MPRPKNITITITGPTKSGKTSAAGVIEQALKNYGATVIVEDLDIEHVNPAHFEDDSLLDFVTATIRTETTNKTPMGTRLPRVATFAPMGGYPKRDTDKNKELNLDYAKDTALKED